MTLRTKLIGAYVSIAIIPLVFVTVLTYRQARSLLEEREFSKLEAIADAKVKALKDYFDGFRKELAVAQASTSLRKALPILIERYRQTDDPLYLETKLQLDTEFRTWTAKRNDIVDVMLVNTDGMIVYASNPYHQDSDIGHNLPDPTGTTFSRGLQDIYISELFVNPVEKNKPSFLAAAPIVDSGKGTIGVLVFEIDAREIYTLIQDTTGLRRTGETQIAKLFTRTGTGQVVTTAESVKHGDYALFLNALRFDPHAAFQLSEVFRDGEPLRPSQLAVLGKNGKGISTDYRDQSVLAVWRYIPSRNWGLVTKIDAWEAFAPTRSLLMVATGLASFFSLLVVVFAWFASGILATSVRRVEEAQKSQEATALRFKLAVDSAHLGVWEWDIVRNELIWDDQMYSLYGIKKSDFSGAYDAWQKGLHPDDKKRGDEQIQLALQGKKSFNTEFRVVWSDGSVRYLRAFGLVLRDKTGKPLKMIGVNFDVTMEHRSMEEIKRFKLAVESSYDHIIITDHKGIIVFANKSAERITGYTQEEMIGQTPALWGKKMPLDFYERMWTTIKTQHKTFTGEITNKRKNGEEYIAEIHLSPILDEHGSPAYFLGIERDITQIKKLDQAKTEFVSLASHQLRTPLTAIKWIISTLADGKMGPLEAAQKDILDDAKLSVNRMNETISTMLMISRIETNNLPLKNEPLSVEAILEELQNQMKNIYEPKKQQVSVECPADITLVTDRKILMEIITNLMSNAVKYTPNEGKISWIVKKDATTITLSISDSGYGIPEKDKKSIFSRFFRAENVKSMQTEGTGLGLYLVASLVKVLGGTITFTSVESQGTTFTCIFPLTPTANGTNSHR